MTGSAAYNTPTGDELVYMSTIDMVGLLNDRLISSRELLAAMVDRIDRLDHKTNVVVTVEPERAMVQAAAVDKARAGGRGGDLGPLAGLPMTVKDSMMVDGMRTTSGAPELADYVADQTADSVAGLIESGAIVFGKTNLPIYAGDVQTFNDVFGVSNNPWDPARTVGGSSGGSAGALAAGFTPLEVGSDIAGSIRNPAAMCGVVGHKSSYGIVSGRGQIPGPPGTYTEGDIAVIGPMARTVADCRLALDLMIGPNSWNAAAWSINLRQPRHTELSGLRVAVMDDDPYCPVDPEISAAIRDVADEMSNGGAVVSFTARPDDFNFPKADETFLLLLGGALSGSWSHAEIEVMAGRILAGEVVDGGLGVEGATLRHRAWLSANERRLQMRARWLEFFRDWDVVLAPISPTVAISHDHSHPMSSRVIDVAGTVRPYTEQMRWMGLFGLVYLPATAVPIGVHSSGLPMGLQVVGPFLEDLTALAVAELVETITGGFQRPPGW